MQKFLLIVCLSVFLSSCAVTQSVFYLNPAAVSDSALCRAYINRKTYNDFASDLYAEMTRRNLSSDNCKEIIESGNSKIASAVTAIAVVGVIAAAARHSKGEFSPSYYQSTSNDVDWDEFYDQNYKLVWRCREIHSGQFADDYRCNGLSLTDKRWPEK